MEIIGSFIIAIIQSILFYGREIGISMLLFSSLANGIIIYLLHRKNKIQNKKGFLLIVPIILLSSTYFIFANKTFYMANIFVILILNIIMYAIVINKEQYFKHQLYISWNLLKSIFTDLSTVIEFTKGKTTEYIKISDKVKKENIKKIAISLLIVFAIVGVVIALLASADSIFANIFSNIGHIFENIQLNNMFSIILRIAIIVIVYIIVLNFILNLKENNVNQEEKSKKDNSKYIFTIKILLIALNIVYLIFCFIQISSLFAKININESFNYSSYARTGFFQLMFVSFINFAVILISNKCNENKEKIIKILNLFLVVFTIIIALSSMYRMHMYEMEYGLTYLRTFVYIILITEILTFIPVTIHFFNEDIDFIKWSFVLWICIYCIVNYINIEKIIVDKNINRTTSTREIDYDYISQIVSTDSYEVIEKRLGQKNLTSEEKLDLNRILARLSYNSKKMHWQEFNMSKWLVKKRNVDTKELNQLISELEEKVIDEENTKEKIEESKNYVYREVINEDEEYVVIQSGHAMGTDAWTIGKFTDNGTKYTEINTITVSGPSKIKFFEDGLGFLEKPTNIYCGASDLLITKNSGKTFNKIEFPKGKFTLSDPKGEKWENCYDYFYLPTREKDGTLTVLASGGYEGGYNQGKTRAKYISKDNGKTWQFEKEIFK